MPQDLPFWTLTPRAGGTGNISLDPQLLHHRPGAVTGPRRSRPRSLFPTTTEAPYQRCSRSSGMSLFLNSSSSSSSLSHGKESNTPFLRCTRDWFITRPPCFSPAAVCSDALVKLSLRDVCLHCPRRSCDKTRRASRDASISKNSRMHFRGSRGGRKEKPISIMQRRPIKACDVRRARARVIYL